MAGTQPTRNDDKQIPKIEKERFRTLVKTKFKDYGLGMRSSTESDFESDEYDFNHEKRGLALVISNENFETSTKSRREGTQKDNTNLETQLKCLGFDVEIFPNLTKDQMFILAETAASDYPHHNADCFLCVVLTHGEHEDGKDTLLGTDGKSILTETIVHCFSDENCPSLINKPRLFFIEACRGKKADTSIEDSHKREETPYFTPCPTPLYQDCMIMYPTPPGFYSFIHYDKGSWFIENLCEYFRRLDGKMSFLPGLTYVCGKVAERQSDNPDFRFRDKMEAPVVDTMLIKDIFMTRREEGQA